MKENFAALKKYNFGKAVFLNWVITAKIIQIRYLIIPLTLP